MRPLIFVYRQCRRSAYVVGILASFTGITIAPAAAQQDLLRPGEGFATRFSGTASVNGPDGKPVVIIDPSGTVGSIVDLRVPGHRPAGEHWFNEPQRRNVTAREVGQVFGVALDAASPPNIYLTATSAFGLHRSADNSRWADGMWGASGGPGTVYRLDRDAGYQARVFANVTLNGRPNSGPGLGNIAFDKWNQQLFVSDLETGMIHRLRAADGADLGFYDHGTQGRVNFIDVVRGQPGALPPIAFDPASRPRVDDCPTGKFDNSPECWNFAVSGRRIWGLAAWKHPVTGETRLYYSVWSSPSFGDASWGGISGDSEKRNSIWSIRLGPDGGFVVSDIRREFLLPDFFTDADTIARSGHSSPVSDITFPECGGSGIMLLGERGGIRNVGLEATNPFAAPHEARALQAGLSKEGSWRVIGRYDVGFYNRRLDGEPFVRANCAGGVAFGPGYSPNGTANLAQPDQFAWISGDALCSVDGPCNNPARSQAAPGAQPQTVADQPSMEPDDSEVHGLQGMPRGLLTQITPPRNANDQAAGADQAYLIDLDINVDPTGAVLPDTLVRNDATKIGDVAVYQICEVPPGAIGGAPPPAAFALPVIQVAHWPVFSHSRAGTHNPQYSHYRHGTHNPKLSHERERSHTRSMTHHRRISGPSGPDGHRTALSGHAAGVTHNPRESGHRSPQTHNPRLSTDLPVQSHYRKLSHVTPHTHNPRLTHMTKESNPHDTKRTHLTAPSHSTEQTHLRGPSHRKGPSHTTAMTHRTKDSNEHDTKLTHRTRPSVVHDTKLTHETRPSVVHTTKMTHQTRPSVVHDTKMTHRTRPSVVHNTKMTHRTRPSVVHTTKMTHQTRPSHNPRLSNDDALPRLGPGLQGPGRGGFGPGGGGGGRGFEGGGGGQRGR